MSPAGDGQPLTLRNLGADVLALVLARLQTREDRRHAAGVSRFFEALTYATSSVPDFNESNDQYLPGQHLAQRNDLLRAALSTHLTRIELNLSGTPEGPRDDDEEPHELDASVASVLRVHTAAAVLPMCKFLRELELIGIGWHRAENGVSISYGMVQSLHRCTRLTKLDVVDVCFRDLDPQIAGALRAMQQLETFTCSHASFGGRAVGALHGVPGLRHVSVLDCADQSTPYLRFLTLPHLVTLELKGLREARFQTRGTAGPALEVLKLAGTFEDDGSDARAMASLRGMPRIRAIDLDMTLTLAGIRALAGALPTNPALTTLKLRGEDAMSLSTAAA